MLSKQGAWGLWWLCIVTFSIYNFVWFHRTNRELCALLGREVPANGRWWSQLIPFYAAASRRNTARRFNEAAVQLGSPTQVSPWMFGFWAFWWYASHTRYLQRRLNTLHDVLAARGVQAHQLGATV